LGFKHPFDQLKDQDKVDDQENILLFDGLNKGMMKLNKSENKFNGYKKHDMANHSYADNNSKERIVYNYDRVSDIGDETVHSTSPLHGKIDNSIMSKTATNKLGTKS